MSKSGVHMDAISSLSLSSLDPIQAKRDTVSIPEASGEVPDVIILLYPVGRGAASPRVVESRIILP